MVDVISSARSPADPTDEIGRFAVCGARARSTTRSTRARAAFPAWRDAGFEARAAVLRRFAALANERARRARAS